MKLLKPVSLALASGSLLLAFAIPAQAQGYARGDRGDRGGSYSSGKSRGDSNRGWNRGHDRRDHDRGGYNRGGHDHRDGRYQGQKYSGYGYRGFSYNRYGSYRPPVSYSRPGYVTPRYPSTYYRPGPRPGYTPRYRYNPGTRVVYAPATRNNWHYRNYSPRYRVGYRLPYPQRYVINDYWRFGLYQPPAGHYWVRYDNDAYLAAAGTGLVVGLIVGALAGG